MASDLGLNPTTSGDLIRLTMPALTEETRQEYIKQARTEAENSRISIRNIRREANDELKKLLKDKTVKRVVFSEITKNAVKNGIANPRDIDTDLVDAYLARRALDYLFGFNLSPVLWRKLPGAKSAGRVQSVALRLICERELAIESFEPEEYWKIKGNIKFEHGFNIEANLLSVEGKKVEKLAVLR